MAPRQLNQIPLGIPNCIAVLRVPGTSRAIPEASGRLPFCLGLWLRGLLALSWQDVLKHQGLVVRAVYLGAAAVFRDDGTG